MPFPRCFLPLLFVLLFAEVASAQLGVGLNLKRRFYMVHEPVMATVSIKNSSGRDLTLADTPQGVQWFSFSIVGADGRTVPPRKADYTLEPLDIKAGETVKRTVNLNELYQMGDFGFFKVTANIHLTSADRYFSSRPEPMEITIGSLVWKQTVGVPEGVDNAGALRTFSLLTHEQKEGKILYAQVEGKDDGVIYGCYPLGRTVEGYEPDAKIDSGNNLAVLQLVGQKTFLLSRIGVNGGFLGQSTYITVKGRPRLRQTADGTLQILGAIRETRLASEMRKAAPKLSDRPPGLPVAPSAER